MKSLQKTPRIISSYEEWVSLKSQVFDRDQWKCRICNSRVQLTADHVIKRSQGGDDILQNLWSLCTDCHRRKDERKLNQQEIDLIPIGSKYGQPCRFKIRPV
jgi:5-methylcytosine-specific restriction endonuclease McrA